MSDSKSHIICVTCQRGFPDDLKPEDAPRYFAQEPLLPRSDFAHAFVSEADTIVGFIEAIAYVTQHGEDKEIDEGTYNTIFHLVEELSKEAQRRNDLALHAIDEIWQRDHGNDEYVKVLAEGRE